MPDPTDRPGLPGGGEAAEHDEFLDLCAAYALESLDPEERELLEQHLAEGCPLCAAVLPRFQSTVNDMSVTVEPITPDPATRVAVLAALRARAVDTGEARNGPGAAEDTVAAGAPKAPVGGKRSTGRRQRSDSAPVQPIPPRRMGWIGLIGWAAAVAFAVLSYVSWNDRQKARHDLRGAQEALSQLEDQVRQEAQWGSVMTARDSEIVVLLPTAQGSPDLHARVTYDPSSERAVIVFENLRAPEDRDFQLWAIRDGSPQSLGLIEAVSGGYAVVRLESVGTRDLLSAFAVSIEDKGGSSSATPEGEVIMVGSLEN